MARCQETRKQWNWSNKKKERRKEGAKDRARSEKAEAEIGDDPDEKREEEEEEEESERKPDDGVNRREFGFAGMVKRGGRSDKKKKKGVSHPLDGAKGE